MIRLLQTPLLTQVPLVSLTQRLFGAHGRNVAFTFRSSTRVTEILQDRVDVPSNRNTLNGFRTFCSGKDLSTKKCVSCSSGDMRPMTEQAANQLIQQVPEWNLTNDGGTMKLSRSWKVKTFLKGLEFFQAVANVAEGEGHHPDLHLVGWNNVNIDIWTHSVGGLAENDFILAAKINGLDVQHLLSGKPAK
ncbi:unnamed protein product [Camellia sinensis]